MAYRKYVLFEGIDGSGKTQLVADVAEFAFNVLGQKPLVTREPGTPMDPVCEQLRGILKSGLKINPVAGLFLFMADRAQHTDIVLKPAIADARLILQDRGFLSTFAYQGYGYGHSLEEISHFNGLSALPPDLIVLMSTDPEIAWNRIKDRARDRFEERAFQLRVHRGFEDAATWGTASPSPYPWPRPPILRIDGAKTAIANVHLVIDAIIGVWTNPSG